MSNGLIVPPTGMNDHDLLVIIHTKLERALVDIREVRDSLSGRLADVESSMTNTTEMDALTQRVTRLERLVWMGLGGLTIAQVAIANWNHLFK